MKKTLDLAGVLAALAAGASSAARSSRRAAPPPVAAGVDARPSGRSSATPTQRPRRTGCRRRAAAARAPGRPRASGARPSDADGSSVDAIVAALYASVSHGEDARAELRPHARDLPPGRHARSRRRTRASDLFTVLDVDGFEERVRKAIAAGKQKGDPTSFFEREAARKTDCFGNVCQVFSTYESRRAPSDEKPFVRGINSIQLVNDGQPLVDRLGRLGHRAAGQADPAAVPPERAGAIPPEYLKKN